MIIKYISKLLDFRIHYIHQYIGMSIYTILPYIILLGAFCINIILVASITTKPALADLEDYPIARLKLLDKITARTHSLDVQINQSIEYGPLFITLRTCRKAPPIDPPRRTAFLEIVEKNTNPDADDDLYKWVFSGWMFASSPALSSMDHPVYDVWVVDCLKESDHIAPATQHPLHDQNGQIKASGTHIPKIAPPHIADDYRQDLAPQPERQPERQAEQQPQDSSLTPPNFDGAQDILSNPNFLDETETVPPSPQDTSTQPDESQPFTIEGLFDDE